MVVVFTVSEIGHVRAADLQPGDILTTAGLAAKCLDTPTEEMLMTMTKQELKKLLSSVSLRIKNFDNHSKQQVVQKLLQNWGVLTVKIAASVQNTLGENPAHTSVEASSSSESEDNGDDNDEDNFSRLVEWALAIQPEQSSAASSSNEASGTVRPFSGQSFKLADDRSESASGRIQNITIKFPEFKFEMIGSFNKTDVLGDVVQQCASLFDKEAHNFKGVLNPGQVAGNKSLNPYKSLADNNINDGATLVFEHKLQGGGLIRKHLTKDEAMKKLKNKVVAHMKIQDEPEDDIIFEDEFNVFLQKAQQKVEDIKMLRAQGTDVVATGLRTISDDALNTLKELMSFNQSFGRRGGSEEKVLKVVSLMFPSLVALDTAKLKLSKVQELMMKDLIDIYVQQFSKYHDGVATFDNLSFVQAVEREITRRKTIREQGIVPRSEDVSRCVIS
jgi:hypothetical protein